MTNSDKEQQPQQTPEDNLPIDTWTDQDEELLKKKLEELRKRDPFIYP